MWHAAPAFANCGLERYEALISGRAAMNDLAPNGLTSLRKERLGQSGQTPPQPDVSAEEWADDAGAITRQFFSAAAVE